MNSPSFRDKRRPPFILASLGLVLALAWLMLPDEQKQPDSPREPDFLPVTVVQLSPVSDTVSVASPGITQARWPTPVVAAVAGRVVELPDNLKPGVMVSRNQLLTRIQAVNYQAELDRAASRLAEAELALARARHEQTVALQIPRAKALTPLARHEPQVNAAEAETRAATSDLQQARQQLHDTEVRAPFPAIILEQKVTPAKWVQPGEELFLIADSRSIDVRVELPADLWARLGEVYPGLPARVQNRQGTVLPAKVRYLSPTRDEKTRQRSLVLKVAAPYQGDQPLLPDQQVQVIFPGKEYAHVFPVPASSVTDDGLVWTIDEQNRLQPEAVISLHNPDNEVALVQFVKQPDVDRRIVLYPLGSMLKGQKVTPELNTDDNGAGL
ncbi:MAG: efflux RND transporter periplasmic adaptor subunit [Endozoicomonas sp.]